MNLKAVRSLARPPYNSLVQFFDGILTISNQPRSIVFGLEFLIFIYQPPYIQMSQEDYPTDFILNTIEAIMPPLKMEQPKVLMFDIGGVCVGNTSHHFPKPSPTNPLSIPLPSHPRLRTNPQNPSRLDKPQHISHRPQRLLAQTRTRRNPHELRLLLWFQP